LQKYELPIEQSIMPWKGIKINPQTGQNDLASGVIVQLFQPAAGAPPKTPSQFYSVWPFGTAAKEVKFPVSGWTTPR
jgi:hypothetical protein